MMQIFLFLHVVIGNFVNGSKSVSINIMYGYGKGIY